MSERAADDVRGEPRRAAAAAGGAAAAAARQQQQPPQPQRQPPPPLRRLRPEDGGSGAASTSAAVAMATVGERRPLPSPEAMLGQSWNLWVEASKLPGKDGTELDESFKEFGKNREVMGLCREDMPIFGLCPAHDDFYLVVCNDCNQVVKPQAFQSHYERRHSSSNKPSLAVPPTSVFSFFPSLSKSKGGSASGGSRSASGGVLSASSLSSKLLKSPKEKLQLRGNTKPMHPIQQSRVPHARIMTPSVKVEKIHPKMDGTLLKSAVGPTCPATVSSSVKPGLNCPSIPKPTLPSPGQILNGKGLTVPPTLEKKSEDNSSNRKFLNKRLSEREFDPDIHCGVIDLDTKKPCTRSLTCKTHSLTQRRAVQGRRKRFDVLLAEHKNKTREKESIRHLDSQQPTQPLRDPHPAPPRTSQEPHQNSHGVIPSESKPFVASKPKPHTPSLPRPPGCPAQQGGSAPIDPPPVHESPHPPLPATEPASRLSSEEGEGDDKEESVEKLDCHYSGHHPQPASFCTFGSRQIGRGYYVFDSRWNRLRCALNLMVEKHLNAQLWKKIPPVPSTTSPVSTRVPHRTNSVPTSQCGVSYLAAATMSTSPVLLSSTCISPNSKSVPAHGTTLNAQPATSGAIDPVCSMQSRQVSSSSSSPSTPSGLSSVPSSPMSRKPQKLKSSKSLRPKEPSGGSTNCHNSSSSSASGTSGKKRKAGSPLLAHSSSSAATASSSHSVESFRKNCVAHSGPPYPSTVTSSHGISLNCVTNKANSSVRHEQSGRGALGGSPAESIKRMSVMVNSGDSTLSLGPFIHQASELPVNSHGSYSHTPLDKLIGKKRKCSPGSSGGGSSSSSSKPTKVAKLPAMNNVHMKHPGTSPGTQGLTNSSFLHQDLSSPCLRTGISAASPQSPDLKSKDPSLTTENSTGRNNLDTFDDKLHLHSALWTPRCL
ncbi:ataxin-7 isoform X1 [Molossus molossus]|uniref:Ataxin 7 n=1 Tax=Molossus molossus TaxID=27622 RepID=A0A7J8DA15_MOLMO|nr:ataxin-7 isoform X1 [Molossus molossus]XP_036122541.1 ataxin-7 isoform X1 [Molossus molossus]XP_036122542.1 ataxin-7 isoform X1 [Molossus molossus]XP_036122543.1 ataxin-7 isoform X1 [Molossus molossus]XP_036122544.1 ataxin-7 isoform X1 [Molossus molossus]XP_036122545.1 ataxin-7 isoform X1 [Molossus molossus]XP_036122546.1 ataxin-7 isoform X1 [Molossus molossus]XP_036122547.1 ataxin-7 isoform X1 [Molossus molossus]XP_036122548.1 ataxin-7 isoform X1 [Molossus molossus]XP_036122549.1 ataxi